MQYKPKKEPIAKQSHKFPNAVYYKGVHYFPEDLKESTKREGKPYEIQGVYRTHKWVQDTFYISADLKNIILSAVK